MPRVISSPARTTKQAALKAIELAKANGVKVAFTVSDPFLIEHFRDEFWELIEGPVDLLFCNLEEARRLTTCRDPIECAREIHKHADNVAMTLGENGSILMHEGNVIPDRRRERQRHRHHRRGRHVCRRHVCTASPTA